MQPHNPTIRGRRLARELRTIRENAGLLPEEAARRLGWSRQKVMRIEKAVTKISLVDLDELIEMYGVRPPLRGMLRQLAEEAWKTGWWTTYRDLFTGTFLALEDEATQIREWHPQVVPGLLQTPDYAREVVTSFADGPSEVERRVAARMTRRSLLSRNPAPRLHVVLDEAILHRMLGGAETMRGQFESLLADLRRPNVTVQILPFSVGRHPGLDGTFVVLTFEYEMAPDIVYLEAPGREIFIEADIDVTHRRAVFDQLCDMAMSPDESRARIERAAREITTHG